MSLLIKDEKLLREKIIELTNINNNLENEKRNHLVRIEKLELDSLNILKEVN